MRIYPVTSPHFRGIDVARKCKHAYPTSCIKPAVVIDGQRCLCGEHYELERAKEAYRGNHK